MKRTERTISICQDTILGSVIILNTLGKGGGDNLASWQGPTLHCCISHCVKPNLTLPVTPPGLGTFLVIVYSQGLAWEYLAEASTIIISLLLG